MWLIVLHSLNAGVAGKSPNFYVYAHNSPILVKDPTGRVIPAILVGVGLRAIAGAATGVVVYYTTSALTGSLSDTSIGGKWSYNAILNFFLYASSHM